MPELFEEKDGRYHCTICGWSTQLVNKAHNHRRKKHGDVAPGAVQEASALFGADDNDDQEEE